MKQLIAILVLGIFIAIYTFGYYLNSNTKKPKNCKQINCEGCKINCNKEG